MVMKLIVAATLAVWVLVALVAFCYRGDGRSNDD